MLLGENFHKTFSKIFCEIHHVSHLKWISVLLVGSSNLYLRVSNFCYMLYQLYFNFLYPATCPTYMHKVL